MRPDLGRAFCDFRIDFADASRPRHPRCPVFMWEMRGTVWTAPSRLAGPSRTRAELTAFAGEVWRVAAADDPPGRPSALALPAGLYGRLSWRAAKRLG